MVQYIQTRFKGLTHPLSLCLSLYTYNLATRMGSNNWFRGLSCADRLP